MRAVPISVITVSRGALPGADALAREYESRIQRYTSFSADVVRPNPGNVRDPARQQEDEGKRVARLLTPGDLVVRLDERGELISSEGLAALLAGAGDEGRGRVVVRAAADKRLRSSRRCAARHRAAPVRNRSSASAAPLATARQLSSGRTDPCRCPSAS